MQKSKIDKSSLFIVLPHIASDIHPSGEATPHSDPRQHSEILLVRVSRNVPGYIVATELTCPNNGSTGEQKAFLNQPLTYLGRYSNNLAIEYGYARLIKDPPCCFRN